MKVLHGYMGISLLMVFCGESFRKVLVLNSIERPRTPFAGRALKGAYHTFRSVC